MNLSANFPLNEFIKSDTAIRRGIDNTPSEQEIAALKRLCENVLQPARNALGAIKVNSGFRSQALNKQIGGAKSSQHCNGEAADIECPGLSNLALAKWIAENCAFDQLILEGFNAKEGPNSGWVHVSFAQKNRGEMLICEFVGGKATYKPANFKTKP